MSIGTVTFTPRGADSWADPWGEYAALRTHDPVHHVVPPEHPERDYYVLSRHADILAAAVDTQTFSSAQGLTTAYGEIEAIVAGFGASARRCEEAAQAGKDDQRHHPRLRQREEIPPIGRHGDGGGGLGHRISVMGVATAYTG